MSFCICDAEGYAHLCPTQRRQCPICKSYEQGQCAPLYPVPAIPYVFQWNFYLGMHLEIWRT